MLTENMLLKLLNAMNHKTRATWTPLNDALASWVLKHCNHLVYEWFRCLQFYCMKEIEREVGLQKYIGSLKWYFPN